VLQDAFVADGDGATTTGALGGAVTVTVGPGTVTVTLPRREERQA
jgi:hypothetical protein